MTFAYASFVVGIVVVAACGLLVYVTNPASANWCQTFLTKLATIRDTCIAEFGRYGGALLVLLASSAAAVIIPWPFGRLARRELHNIDVPFYRWSQHHVRTTGGWHHINAVVTHMGNRPTIKVVAIIAAVIFAALWSRRGFWIPPMVIAAAFGFEKFGQMVLGKVVARQHTPLFHDLGTFPSGGCARVITVYGIIVYLALLTWPSLTRPWRVGGFTLVALLAWVEGYTRLYLFKHWLMDVFGGWLFGTLMLFALIAATSCFATRSAPDPAPAERERALVA
jgi:membrane-associated phospholipid phosphatase